MPFCPVCRSEYVEGVKTCADCGAELVAELPPVEEPFDPTMELVEVSRAANEVEAQIVHGLLEAAGIRSVFRGESLRLTHGITVDGLAEVKILVRRKDVEEARRLIDQSENWTSCPHCGVRFPMGQGTCPFCGYEFQL